MNRDALAQAKGNGLTVFGESLQSFAPKNLNKFDVVCLFQVVEHISEVGEFLAACIETMRPGGKLILSVPNNDALMFRLQNLSPLNSPPHHMGLWEINSLISLADILPLSLKSVEYEPLQPYHFADCKELIRQRLVENEHCAWSDLAECEPVTSKVMELVLENIPGHTIMVVYTKL
jgi:SAM-dependent methyltransferase